MKNLFLLFTLISTNIFSQSFTETSHGFYILNKDKTDWKDLIVSKTQFEITQKEITFLNYYYLESFKITDFDSKTNYDNGDLLFRVWCIDSENKEVEVIFMTSKDCERYIYVLSEDKSLSFNIN